MKYLFSAIALCGLVQLTSCQSNTQEKNAAQDTKTEAAATPHTQSNEAATTAHPQGNEAAQAQQTPAMATAPAASIPAFKFYKVKSGIGFSNENLDKNKNTVFILFDPNCGHCQQETSQLSKNYAKIKDINIYFVSMNDPALMASFLETFGKELVDKPNIEVLYDRNQDFIQKFHVPKQFPASYVYGPDGRLKNNWDGDRPFDFVLAEYTK